ncbi:MAG: PHP domain-containing protein [Erysipelotrichaceae bacterium]|nr:PHP domain-containing protein [Erysipelotrichaceae bacterium]
MEAQGHLSKQQIARVYRKEASHSYQQEGYKSALFVSNAFLLERIFAFAFDTCIMFLPILLWELCMLLIFLGLFPIGLLEPLQIVTFIMIVISMFTFNALLSVKSGGQTLGKYFYDLKVVNKRRKEAAVIKLMAREVIGFSLPAFVLMLFFNMMGVVLYWAANFVFMLIHPRHILFIDLLLGTRIVVLREPAAQKNEEIVRQSQPIQPSAFVPKTTIDLHLHSNFSDDGQYNVEELFQLAAGKGLRMISICDHNSVKANLIAQRMAELYHVTYIAGAEFDCRYRHMHLRILGYFIDSANDIFAHLENESLKRERNASLRRAEAFREHTGIAVDVAALLEKNRYQNISGAMIAKQVLENPALSDEVLLRPYRIQPTQKAAIHALVQDYFRKGAPCYVEVHHPKVEDILDIIHLSGGVAVLSCAKSIWEEGTSFFEEVIGLGIEGIEVFTPRYDAQDMAILLKAAKEHQLFVTCGSDFHGPNKSEIRIGETNCPKEAEKIISEFMREFIHNQE